MNWTVEDLAAARVMGFPPRELVRSGTRDGRPFRELICSATAVENWHARFAALALKVL